MKELLKKMIFWRQIRKYMILRTHKRVAKYCRHLIDECEYKGYICDIKPRKVLTGKRIIWQYWAQGYDNGNLPDIVKLCLKSVDEYCCAPNYEVIRLSDNNIDEYLEFSQEIKLSIRNYSKAFFSDFLRCVLLSNYGGCWLDATVLLTKPLPDKYWNESYFLFQRDEYEGNKHYWSNSFYYYFDWHPKFKVRMLSSIIFSKSHLPLFESLKKIMSCFILSNKELPDYFFFQILYNELVNYKYPEWKCPVESDCLPHYLQQYINDPNFRDYTPEEILSKNGIHKLTYKFNVDVDYIRKLISK